jgi:hypothetical protein
MSKAKELAREMLDEATDMRYKGHATIKFFDKVEELIDAVLSEPEPELKGWIEVSFMRKTDPDSLDNKALLDLKTIKMFCFDSGIGKVGIEFYNQIDQCFHVHESLDEIKQLIKESQ